MTKLFEANEWLAKYETLEYGQRAFTASVTDKRGRPLFRSAYYTTREEAVAEAFEARPKAKSVTSGYGLNGTFDIRWHDRNEPKVV